MRQRIDYIDLMKGVCITLIVFYHSDVYGVRMFEHACPVVSDMLRNVQLPMFFFLAGLFFSTGEGLGDFLARKVQKLLVPYAFFCAVPTVFADALRGQSLTLRYVYDLFVGPANMPMWFVICLFFQTLAYYAAVRLCRRKPWLLHTLALALPALALLLYTRHEGAVLALAAGVKALKVPLLYCRMLDALFMLPFFHIGATLRGHGLLNSKPSTRVTILVLITATALWRLTAAHGVDPGMYLYGRSAARFYIGALCGITAVWCLCRLSPPLPPVAYLGRGSLIILGTHKFLLSYAVDVLRFYNPFALTAATLLLMFPVIYAMGRLFPHLTARRYLLTWSGGRLRRPKSARGVADGSPNKQAH